MPVDVVELRNFYASPLGKGVQNIIGNIVKKQWDNCSGLSILGIGYAPPYLETFRSEAMRVLAFMPADQVFPPPPELTLPDARLPEAREMLPTLRFLHRDRRRLRQLFLPASSNRQRQQQAQS